MIRPHRVWPVPKPKGVHLWVILLILVLMVIGGTIFALTRGDDGEASRDSLTVTVGTDEGAEPTVTRLDCEGIDTAHVLARHAIAALSALGWVEGQRHATVCDACETLTVTYVAITRERDALRAALEKITRLPIYGHDPQDAIALATAAITAAKGTP